MSGTNISHHNHTHHPTRSQQILCPCIFQYHHRHCHNQQLSSLLPTLPNRYITAQPADPPALSSRFLPASTSTLLTSRLVRHLRTKLIQQRSGNLCLQPRLLLSEQLLRKWHALWRQLSSQSRWNMFLRAWLHQLQRGLFQVPPGCLLELISKPMHLCLRAKLRLLRLRCLLRLQRRLRILGGSLPVLSRGILYHQRILCDLPSKLFVQFQYRQVRLPGGFLHQPVGHLHKEMRK